MKSQMTACCACGPAGGGITLKRTPSRLPAGSTYERCTSICGVWAYESKKPGLSSTSLPKTIPMRDTCVSISKSWPNFGYDTCPGRGHVAVVATVSTAWRDGGPSRDPGAG